MTLPSGDLRVRFQEGQVLQARDLNDEQAYRLVQRRRHNISMHGWGIVRGLELEINAGGAVVVCPGMAIDGYGRELLLIEPFTVPFESLNKCPEANIAVTLRYHREPVTPLQRGAYPCGPGQHSRWHEETRVCLLFFSQDSDANDIMNRLALNCEVDPKGELPDDPNAVSPVYLGRILKDASTNPPTIDLTGRRYAALMGETMRAASRAVQLSIGAPHGIDGARFAVSLPDSHGGYTDDRLTVDSPGPTVFRGRTTLASRLQPGERMSKDSTAVLATNSLAVGSRPTETLDNRRSDLVVADHDFTAEDLKDPTSIACKLGLDQTEPLRGLRQALIKAKSKLAAELFAAPQSAGTAAGVAVILNELMRYRDLGDSLRRQVVLRPATWHLLHLLDSPPTEPFTNIGQTESERLLGLWRDSMILLVNRMLLEDLFADEILIRDDRPAGAWGLELKRLPEPPKVAAPWRAYLTEAKQESTPPQPLPVPLPELRIEIADPGGKGDPTRSRFVVGFYGLPCEAPAKDVTTPEPTCLSTIPQAPAPNTTTFQPCLTVDAACTVTVRGKLRVFGDVVEGPIGADPNDSRLQDKIVEGWVAGAMLAVDTLEVDIIQPPTPVAGQTATYTVSVTNKGPQVLSSVGVYDALWITDAPGRQVNRPLRIIPTLGVGTAAAAVFQVPPFTLPDNSGNGTLEIVLTLFGITPSLQQMYHSKTFGPYRITGKSQVPA